VEQFPAHRGGRRPDRAQLDQAHRVRAHQQRGRRDLDEEQHAESRGLDAQRDAAKSDIVKKLARKTARAQGALTILAHPLWTGNSLDVALRGGFEGVEVYNHVCHWLNGKDDGRAHWNALLEQNPNTLAFSVDDAHLRPEHPGWNGGWIVVNTHAFTREALFQSIWKGNFYASCGPEFHTIELNGRRLHVTTSSVQFIRLVGPGSEGERLGSFDGEVLYEASFILPEKWSYAYLEIENLNGKRAWSNPLLEQ